MGILFSLFVFDFDLLSHFCVCSTSLWVWLALFGLLVSEIEKKDSEFSASSS